MTDPQPYRTEPIDAHLTVDAIEWDLPADPLALTGPAEPGEATYTRFGGSTVLTCTPAQHAEWHAAATTLTRAVEGARTRLDAAIAVLTKEFNACQAIISAAATAYEPTRHAIDARFEELALQAEAKEAAAQARADAEAARLLAEDDAVLGPREWAIYRRTRATNGSFRKDWNVPTIHRADCSVIAGENLPRVRLQEVWDAVRDGAPEASKRDFYGNSEGRRLPASRCSRCHVEDLLVQALGDRYTALRATEEAAEQPPFNENEFANILLNAGLPWRTGHPDGHLTRVSADRLTRLEFGEDAIGWSWKGHAWDNAERLQELQDAAPDLGYATRRLTYAKDLGERVKEGDTCEYALAVRPMNAAERRTFTETHGYAPGSRHTRGRMTKEQMGKVVAKIGRPLYQPPSGRDADNTIDGFRIQLHGARFHSKSSEQMLVFWDSASFYKLDRGSPERLHAEQLQKDKGAELADQLGSEGYLTVPSDLGLIVSRMTIAEKEARAAAAKA